MSNPSCCECCTTSVAICVNCHGRFCLPHFVHHRQTYEKYLDETDQPLSACLHEFESIQKKLHSDIDQWENDTTNEVQKSAKGARRTLDAYINSYLSHFNEESSNLRDLSGTESREIRLNRLEKLRIEYQQSLKDLYLVKMHDRGQMLDVETRNSTKEPVSLTNSSQTAPQESDTWVPQTSMGERLVREPLTQIMAGAFWAMGGSDQQILIQEYQNKQLTLFDCHGNRGVSMTWHYDLVIRDIVWYEESRRFFILLDKKLLVFDPVTKHIQEIKEIKPYQSNSFRRCTGSHDQLFIGYWGQESLVELIRVSTWEVEQRWMSPVTCHANELISCIRLNANDELGLCIQDENNPLERKFRFEIRDLALNILHTLPLFVDSGIFSRMIALPDSHWALLNVDATFIFVVDQNGVLMDKIDWTHGLMSNIAIIGNHTIVIRTPDKIYFYDVDFKTKH